MRTLKNIVKGGFIVVLINFCVINLVTLINAMNDKSVDYSLELFNLELMSMEVNNDSFGYIIMPGGFLISFIVGGLIGLVLSIFMKRK